LTGCAKRGAKYLACGLTAGSDSYLKNHIQHLTQTILPLNIWFWFLSAFGGLIFDTL
jgi:hypothetical protein